MGASASVQHASDEFEDYVYPDNNNHNRPGHDSAKTKLSASLTNGTGVNAGNLADTAANWYYSSRGLFSPMSSGKLSGKSPAISISQLSLGGGRMNMSASIHKMCSSTWDMVIYTSMREKDGASTKGTIVDTSSVRQNNSVEGEISSKSKQNASIDTAGSQQFCAEFFELLAATDADVSQLFNPHTRSTAQGKTRNMMIINLVQYLLSITDCSFKHQKRLRALGRSHVRIGVTEQQVNIFNEVLLRTIISRLGVRVTADMVQSWSVLLAFCVEEMFCEKISYASYDSKLKLIVDSSGKESKLSLKLQSSEDSTSKAPTLQAAMYPSATILTDRLNSCEAPTSSDHFHLNNMMLMMQNQNINVNINSKKDPYVLDITDGVSPSVGSLLNNHFHNSTTCSDK
jgi:hemoglobin-like flavoprotein